MGVLEACKPRDEVLKGDLQDAIFAADFGELIAGTAHPVYGDPKTFFRNTHPAESLKKIVRAVFGRLADPTESGITLRLTTGFGGGKTHTLMTLWHMAQNAHEENYAAELLAASARPSQVRVVAIDASKAGKSVFGEHENGKVATHSLAGEVFYQLGGAEALARLGKADSPDDTPPDSQLASVIPDGPVLFLLDELVIYQQTLDQRQQGNLLSFITKLLQRVANRPQTVMVVTDPGAQKAYADEARLLREAIDGGGGRTNALDEVFDRITSEFDPIGREGPQVISRRLFESVDHGQANTTATAYRSLYLRVHEERPELIPPEAIQPEYEADLARCYPFHPRLLRTIRDRLIAIQDFQQNRGMLRLFARILRDVWEKGQDLTLITAGDLDWSSERIQGDLLDRIQRESFRAAVSADVEAHAAELDGGPQGLHRRVASALLLESLPLTPHSGLNEPEVTLATLRLDEAGPEPSEAMGRLGRDCWHTYPMSDGRGLQFRYEPNVNKQIEERMETIPQEDAEQALRAEVQGYFAGGLKLVAWPNSPRHVSDSPTFQVALCDSEARAKAVCAYSDEDEGPRRFRNALVAVAPNASGLADAHARSRRFLAAEQIKKETAVGDDHKLTRDQLAKIMPVLQYLYKLQARRAFDRVVTSTGAYGMEEKFLVTDDPTQPRKIEARDGQQRLRSFLDEKRLVYREDETLDPDRFVDVIVSGATPLAQQPDVTTAKALHERFLSASDMKLVVDAEVTRRAILRALAEGKIVLRLSDGTAYDSCGYVRGPDGQRKRTESATPPSFSIDETVLVCRPEQSSARLWLHVDPGTDKIPGPGPGPIPPIIEPPKPARKPTATDRAEIVDRAASEPVVSLGLQARTIADAERLISLAQPLGADRLSTSVSLEGELRGGGSIGLTASEVPLGHATNPIELAKTLQRGMGEEAEFVAALDLSFGDQGRSGLQGPLQTLCDAAAEGIQIEARFGKAKEGEA